MGQANPKQFAPPKAIGQSPGNGIVTQSAAPPPIPALALQPLIQNQIPTVQTPNAVPTNGVAGSGNYGGTDPQSYQNRFPGYTSVNPFGSAGGWSGKYFEPGQFNVF